MSNTPTSQITRVVSASANANNANVSSAAKFQVSSYLVQGATLGGDGSTLRLEVEKSMQIHHGLNSA